MLDKIKNNIVVQITAFVLCFPFMTFVLDFILRLCLNLGRIVGTYLHQLY